MTRKSNAKGGLGNSILREKQRQIERMKREADALKGITEFGKGGVSVLDQNSIDEIIATVELRQEEWEDEMGTAEYVAGPVEIGPVLDLQAEQHAAAQRQLVSVPRRPAWHRDMDPEELKELEQEAFQDWRRELATTVEQEGYHMTPYEKNLDFWRQLWRCMERSDLLVQIVDSRDIDFYFCRDLFTYMQELGGNRRMVLLANKADFLSDAQRQRWVTYFQSKGVDAIFFSALRELLRQEKEQLQTRSLQERVAKVEAVAAGGATEEKNEVQPERPTANGFSELGQHGAGAEEEDDREPHEVPIPGLNDSDDDLKEKEGDNEDDEGVAKPVLGALADDDRGVADAAMLIEELCSRLPEPQGEHKRRGTIGFIGYPNVGKSTVINAIMGARRVAMSKRPGKTKHIQTMEVSEFGITLCDCPGLVMPSVAASRAHLVINNTVPLDDLREIFAPITLIIEKIGFEHILQRYDCAKDVADARKRSGDHVLDDTHAFLAALAVTRRHFLRVGVPDENWAARKVLKDYVSGALLHVEEPPGTARAAAAAVARAPAASVEGDQDATSFGGTGGDDDDFGDLDSFLKEQEAQKKGAKNMTKRKMRYLNKQMLRKGAPVATDGGSFHIAVANRV